MTDSSTGGYLAPLPAPAPQPLEDAALDNFLQAFVVGITGLGAKFVFPRWQETPPNIPPVGVNWASIGVQNSTPDSFAYVAHNPIISPAAVPPMPNPPSYPNGTDVMIRHEVMDVLCSFYGPNARGNCAKLRDGLDIAQNREVLQLARMGLISVGSTITVPSIVNGNWYMRVDMPVQIKREIVRNYPILNILSVPITLNSETVEIEINVNS